MSTTAGRCDVLAAEICEDNDVLLDLVNDRIQGIEDVISTEVFSILEMEKKTFALGTG